MDKSLEDIETQTTSLTGKVNNVDQRVAKLEGQVKQLAEMCLRLTNLVENQSAALLRRK